MNNYLKLIGALIYVFVVFGCSENQSKSKLIISGSNSITTLDASLLSGADSAVYSIPLVIPIPVLSKNTNLILYDFADGALKQFNLNGFQRSFNPIQEGPNRLGGEYFKGVGLFNDFDDSLLIGSNTEIAVYNLLKQKYNNFPVDNFPHCVSFNDTFQEIFFKKIGEEDVVISQNGNPCYDLGTLSQSVTPDSFNEKFFLRIVSSKREKPIYTLKLPDLKLKNLYERSRLVITYNENDKRFYTMLNPLSYLFVYSLNEETLQLQLEEYWDLDLRKNELPIDYFIENEVNSEIANSSLEYNFELSVLDSFDEFVVVSYQPSKDLIYKIPSEAPYSSHSFLAIINLKNKEIRTFSMNFDEFQFYGASNGRLWIYDVISSENSGYSVFKLPEINELIFN
jgi:hypothetical protein